MVELHWNYRFLFKILLYANYCVIVEFHVRLVICKWLLLELCELGVMGNVVYYALCCNQYQWLSSRNISSTYLLPLQLNLLSY